MRQLVVSLGLLLTICQLLLAQTRSVEKSQVGELDPFARLVTNLRKADRVVIIATDSAKRTLPSAESAPSAAEDDLPSYLRRLATVELKGEKAEELWRLWRGLKNGNGMGCFAPGYLLDFYSGKERILRTEVCFRCCNVTIPNSGGDGIRSICGDGKALGLFKEFVTRELPYPMVMGEE